MKLDLNYPKTENQAEKESNVLTTLNLLEYFINKKHPEVKGQVRRTMGRLQDKIIEAREKQPKTLELAPDEKDLINDLDIPNLDSPVQWSKFVAILEDEVKSLRDVK